MRYRGEIEKVLDIGIALSKEKNRNKLLDMILDGCEFPYKSRVMAT